MAEFNLILRSLFLSLSLSLFRTRESELLHSRAASPIINIRGITHIVVITRVIGSRRK